MGKPEIGKDKHKGLSVEALEQSRKARTAARNLHRWFDAILGQPPSSASDWLEVTRTFIRFYSELDGALSASETALIDAIELIEQARNPDD